MSFMEYAISAGLRSSIRGCTAQNKFGIDGPMIRRDRIIQHAMRNGFESGSRDSDGLLGVVARRGAANWSPTRRPPTVRPRK